MSKSNHKAWTIDFFGEFTWANLLDWLVTLCLGGILVQTALQLGGVRPETQLMIQPLFMVLLALHGLSLAACRPEARKLYLVPLLFVPFLVWAGASIWWWTPVPWRGNYELIYFCTAFLFGWVAVNNVRTRSQLWTLLVMALIPVAQAVFIGYYQFFQNPRELARVSLGYPVELNAQYLGQATGLFADPGSNAAFLLLLLPCFIIGALVPRLPVIVRFLSFYLAVILVLGIALAQTYWAAALVVILLLVVPWFCFEKKRHRYLFAALGVGGAVGVFTLMYFLSPPFERGLQRAFSTEGEGIRLIFWQAALDIWKGQPVFGSGAGSFSLMLEQRPDLALAKLPLTPHNDFLLVLANFGLVGALLLLVPLLTAFYPALQRWSAESFKIKTLNGMIMPANKFFLSLALCATFALLLCAVLHFIIYVPALLLYGVLMTGILVKFGFRRSVALPSFRFTGLLYFLICTVVGFTFWAHASRVITSQGLELQARQRLEILVERGIGVSGNFKLIDQVIRLYEDALIADPGNADAWIGLSMTICQLHYRNPADFERTGSRALEAARRGYGLCPDYWLASAQLGVAQALVGEIDGAFESLMQAIELAPNVSNAHYYYAALMGADTTMLEAALQRVRRALALDPDNAAARRLEQKLLIL